MISPPSWVQMQGDEILVDQILVELAISKSLPVVIVVIVRRRLYVLFDFEYEERVVLAGRTCLTRFPESRIV